MVPLINFSVSFKAVAVFQVSIHRNIQSNKGVNIHNNIQTVILKKNYLINFQFNSETSMQWYC